MLLKHHQLLLSFLLLNVGSLTARGDDLFRDQLEPFMKTYCVKCHNKETAEGLLDLTRYTSASLIAQDFRQWEHVVTFLKTEKMPPEKAKRPAAAERARMLASIDKLLLQEARKSSEDPGVVLPRRLSNSEYNNTIRDLTGVDIRPTASFPLDPASGEGFNNTGEALTMSPSLFKKYYAAAQYVADHVLLTPSDLEFAPFPVVTFADQQKFHEQAIIRFYEQNKVNYETYIAAAYSFRHRPAAKRDATISQWALENNLSPKYLQLLWDGLQGEAPADKFAMHWLRQRWNALPAPINAMQPAELPQRIRALAGDIQRLSTILCAPETNAIVGNAGNAPIQHIDRRKKTAASRDAFNPNLIQTAQRLHREFKSPEKVGAKLVIHTSKFSETAEDGYVILRGMTFSTSAPNNFNPKDAKKNLPLRAILTLDQLKQLKFGIHPLGHAIDQNSLVLKVPATLEIEIPKEAFRDPKHVHFYAEAILDRPNSKLDIAKAALIDRKSPQDDFGNGSVFLVNSEHPRASQYAASCEAFCKLFPNRFFYVDDTRGLSAGFHLIEGFFRDDQPLCKSVLGDAQKQQLDRLWDNLYFGTKVVDKMLHGFVFFERSERNFMKHPDFDSIKEEDPDLGKEENLVRFEEIYLKRSGVKASGAELKVHPIHVFFEEFREGLKRRAAQLKQAEPIYLKKLQAFAQAAYRRPLTAKETRQLIEFYQSIAKQEEYGIERAVQASITRILVSPYFCYRVDLPPSGKAIQPISDLALASRLSYFLWASMPDKELLDLANKGQLNNEETLRAQTRRMLKDPKVSAFALEFFGQWLQYRDFLSQEAVNRQVFPAFDDALKQAMFEEPTRLITHVIQNDLPATTLLHSDFTIVNKRLAQHYGLPYRGSADDWEKADGLLQQGRGGLLGMAVFLTKNSQPQRTSPVKRGFWVVHKLLGEHIPPPPADVAVLPAKETDTKGKSIRELLVLHTDNAKCARCHQQFDPVGLSMEGFDPIGKLRTKDLAGRAIDNVVKLPSGEAAHGVPEFSKYLASHRKNDFTKTLSQKFVGYALGRSLELSDRVLMEKIESAMQKNDNRMMTLFETVVTSPQFRNQRGRDFIAAQFKNEPNGEKP